MNRFFDSKKSRPAIIIAGLVLIIAGLGIGYSNIFLLAKNTLETSFIYLFQFFIGAVFLNLIFCLSASGNLVIHESFLKELIKKSIPVLFILVLLPLVDFLIQIEYSDQFHLIHNIFKSTFPAFLLAGVGFSILKTNNLKSLIIAAIAVFISLLLIMNNLTMPSKTGYHVWLFWMISASIQTVLCLIIFRIEKTNISDLGKMLNAASAFTGFLFLCGFLITSYAGNPIELSGILFYKGITGKIFLLANILFTYLFPVLILSFEKFRTSPFFLRLTVIFILSGRFLEISSNTSFDAMQKYFSVFLASLGIILIFTQVLQMEINKQKQ